MAVETEFKLHNRLVLLAKLSGTAEHGKEISPSIQNVDGQVCNRLIQWKGRRKWF